MKKKLYLKHVSLGKEVSSRKLKLFSENTAAIPNEFESSDLTNGIFAEIDEDANYINIVPSPGADVKLSDSSFEKISYEAPDNSGLFVVDVTGPVEQINGTYYLNSFVSLNENSIFEKYDPITYMPTHVLAWSSIENCWYITTDIENFSIDFTIAKSLPNPSSFFSISLSSWALVKNDQGDFIFDGNVKVESRFEEFDTLDFQEIQTLNFSEETENNFSEETET